MKKFIALLLMSVLMLGSLPFTAMAKDAVPNILGDSNSDGRVNIKDATGIQKYVAKIIDFNDRQIKCADCDGSGVVNVKDATWIQKFIVEIQCPYNIGEELGEETVPTTAMPETTSSEAFTETVATESESVTTAADITETTVSDLTDVTESEASTEVTTDIAETTVTTDNTDATEEPQATSTEVTTSVTSASSPAATEVTEVTDPEESTASDPNHGVELPDHEFPDETEPTTMEEETVIPYTPVKPDTNITIYFSNNQGWNTVNAYVYNEAAGKELKSWPGTAMEFHESNEWGEDIYKLTVDVSVYNRVVFNNGKSQTLNAALTVASSGFFVTRNTPKTAMQLGVYAYGTEDYGTKTTVSLKYPDGYNKPIEIWTPAGYDPADTTKKYSVIYLLDGQNQFDDSDTYEGGWGSDEIITALMKNGGEGYILVGIDNSKNRDSELTPDIGDVIPAYRNGFENGTGEKFSNFVADVVVPYVEANFNVYTDAAHTAIAGSSSGGIEAFYIGLEHMDEFGRIGALSPAFMLFDEATWINYFEKYDFNNIKNLPRIYIYNGGGDSLEVELNTAAKGMKPLLESLGYDSSKITFAYDEKNGHNEAAWRNIMPEVVSWLFELQ